MKIPDNLIPDAATQQHIAILGKTGSGKTTAAKSAIVEPLLAAGRRVGIVDPTSAWWGLRSSRDGKGAGFPVLVLGGDHGDLPLPALGGAAVARLLVEQHVNLVADTSLLGVGERTRWMIDFAGAVYRLNRTPLHLVLDEAHLFAPQQGGAMRDVDTGKMLHAVNQLAAGGRSRGIRLVMLTQRPQKLAKDTLTSADTLIAMRVLAPQDRGAIEDWVKGCGDLKAGAVVLNSLASLQRGEGWIWYPEGAVLERVQFPLPRTFDSSATPTDGGASVAPKGAAEIDLTEIKAALADAVKEAEANDPRLLRKRIAELERERAKASPAVDPEALAAEYQRGLQDGRVQALQTAQDVSKPARELLDVIAGGIANARAGLTFGGALTELASKARIAPAQPARFTNDAPRTARATPAPRPSRSEPPSGVLTGPEQRVLDALAWWASIGIHSPDKGQVGFIAGYRVGKNVGGTFGNLLGALRSRGLLDYPSPGDARLTESGRALARQPDKRPTTETLQQAIFDRLDGPESRVLGAIIGEYPRAIPKQEAGALSGYQVGANVGGTFGNILGRLRSLGLIEYPSPGQVVALPVLFIGA